MQVSKNKLYALSRRDFLGCLGVGCLAPSVLIGCGSGSGNSSAPSANSQLQAGLSEAWQSRYSGKAGGLTLHMIAPNGEYFASTLNGVGPNSYFRAASITKTFTAAGIMLLNQRGQLKLTDTLGTTIPKGGTAYLPGGFDIPYREQITISQLLEHLAGVFDVTNQKIPVDLIPTVVNLSDKSLIKGPEKYLDVIIDILQETTHSFSKDELINVVAKTKLFNAVPGMTYNYSDTHYTILGKIIEVVTGLTLNEFLAKEFLIPNNLSEVKFITDGAEQSLSFPFIEGHSLMGDVEAIVTNYNYSYDPGSGNLVTTTSNLVQWIRKLIKGQTRVDPTQIASMCKITPPATDYGLGLIHKSGVGFDLGWGHNGGTGGYLTDAYHDPITDISYVLQCSLIDFWDLAGQFKWMAQTALNARKAIGY